MAGLLARVKSKLFISSTLRSAHPLDGGYASLVRGRSLDFEDLRPYEAADEVRDIDWRATARAGEPMVRRSNAERRHTVLFVVDSGSGMRALARDEHAKKDLALLVVGALATLAVRHGDDVVLLHSDGGRARRFESRRSEGGIELMLRALDAAIDAAEVPAPRDELLRAVARTFARRMIVVLVTDEAPISAEGERELRRLRVQHDLVWLTLRDADPVLAVRSPGVRRDASTGWAVPEFLHGSAEVVAELQAQRAEADLRRAGLLDPLAITHATLDGQDTAVAALLRMLHRRAAHAR
ncbi:DUF58 domain-containing protein [Pseudolysinimonas sp.]|jgi:uncharacterized protein (DUF58 family)|uniref:DUF58 domain-containing protein n=1 Tax=Pseudolysinimonas sp. TaxID=2680009 RepID=UPI003783598F